MSATTEPSEPEAPRTTWSGRVFSLPVVLGLLLVYLLLFVSAGGSVVRSLADNDIWWHLRNASELARSGHFIRVESYTFTVAGKPWINFEWLGELPYYFANRWLGDRGLYLVMFSTAAAIVLGVYCLGRLRSGSWGAAFGAACIALLLTTVSLLPRPLLFGWLLLVVEVAILWSLQKGRDYTAWLPVVFLLWINVHGSWFIGFVLMAIFVACGLVEGEWGNLYATRWTPQQARKLLVVVAASFAALFANPYGWRLVAYPLDVAFRQRQTVENIAEWGSLDFHSARGKIVVAILVALAVLQLVRRRRRVLQDVAFAAVAVYSAVTYVRFLFLISILVLPLLAIDFRGEKAGTEGSRQNRRFVSAVIMVLLVAAIVARYPGEKKLRAGIAEAFPEKAVPYVQSLAGQGNLLNNFNWGGYLEWEAPGVKEFIDPRNDIFVHEGVMSDYLRATKVEDTFAVLDKYRIRYVLLAEDAPAAYLLGHSAEWTRRYDDGQAVVFERVR
jgi:hypothetical protein